MKYTDFQMLWVSRGRGALQEYGNIDDLDPTTHDAEQMNKISLTRGNKTQKQQR